MELIPSAEKWWTFARGGVCPIHSTNGMPKPLAVTVFKYNMRLSRLKQPLTLAQKARLTKGKLKAYREWLLKQPKKVKTYTGYLIEEKEYNKYKKYLLSKQWQTVRLKAFDFYDNNCCKCGSRFNLQVHHRNYKNLYKETMVDVLLLCESCHFEEHKK